MKKRGSTNDVSTPSTGPDPSNSVTVASEAATGISSNSAETAAAMASGVGSAPSLWPVTAEMDNASLTTGADNTLNASQTAAASDAATPSAAATAKEHFVFVDNHGRFRYFLQRSFQTSTFHLLPARLGLKGVVSQKGGGLKLILIPHLLIIVQGCSTISSWKET